MSECVCVLLAAVALDVFLGDPVYPLHPVRLAGGTIRWVEAALRRAGLSGYGGGILLAAAVLCLSLGSYLGLRFAMLRGPSRLAVFFDIFLVYSCIALQDLLRRAGQVSRALRQNRLEEARRRVQEIVGRDAGRLDAAGIARAAVESVAENFVDGFLSPLFWFVTGSAVARLCGFPPCPGAVLGILAMRMVNTLDSMVGYRNERYIRFGRASARLDDMMNFAPARIAIPVIALAAAACGLKTKNCLKTGRRDRLKHPSPNAGHAESCVAGALDIRLGGPTIYFHGSVEKPWLGDGTPEVSGKDIDRCRMLIAGSGLAALCFALLGLCALL